METARFPKKNMFPLKPVCGFPLEFSAQAGVWVSIGIHPCYYQTYFWSLLQLCGFPLERPARPRHDTQKLSSSPQYPKPVLVSLSFTPLNRKHPKSAPPLSPLKTRFVARNPIKASWCSSEKNPYCIKKG